MPAKSSLIDRLERLEQAIVADRSGRLPIIVADADLESDFAKSKRLLGYEVKTLAAFVEACV